MFIGEYTCDVRGNKITLPRAAEISCEWKWVLIRDYVSRHWREPGFFCGDGVDSAEEGNNGEEESRENQSEIMFLRIAEDVSAYSDTEELESSGFSVVGTGAIQLQGKRSLILPEPFLAYLAKEAGKGLDVVLLGYGRWLEIWGKGDLFI